MFDTFVLKLFSLVRGALFVHISLQIQAWKLYYGEKNSILASLKLKTYDGLLQTWSS